MAGTTLFPSIVPDSDDQEDGADEEPVDVDAQLEAGECPWCDEFDGESPGRHASSAHPEQWGAYKAEEE